MIKLCSSLDSPTPHDARALAVHLHLHSSPWEDRQCPPRWHKRLAPFAISPPHRIIGCFARIADKHRTLIVEVRTV